MESSRYESDRDSIEPQHNESVLFQVGPLLVDAEYGSSAAQSDDDPAPSKYCPTYSTLPIATLSKRE